MALDSAPGASISTGMRAKGGRDLSWRRSPALLEE